MNSSPIRLTVVRHGQSTWNLLGLVQGHDDSATLTRVGWRQATAAANGFAEGSADVLYSSDLTRARQTAAAFSRSLRLPTRLDPRLRERNLGDCEGAPVAGLDPGVTGIRDARVVDAHVRPVGGESVADLFDRAAAFVDSLRQSPRPGHAVVVTHGGFLRVLVRYCSGLGPETMDWEAVPNCAARELWIEPRSPIDRAPAAVGG